MYPLRFEPLFQRYLWGGYRLETLLHKHCGPGPAAESWEIVDHGEFQSKVAYGGLKGHTLRDLLQEYGPNLVGTAIWQKINADHVPAHLKGRFPLLFKFLDADQVLSVQVHPDDQYGATLDPPDLGKTEAWYVMAADPGARIYSGLKAGVTQANFVEAIAAGQTEAALHRFEPQPGDVVFIPAGTIHALGAGLVIAEIQQASNTTFRVYDWDRLDAAGNPRPLHVDHALAVTDFDRGPVEPIRIASAASPTAEYHSLISCEQFVLERYRIHQPITLSNQGSFQILAVTNGQVLIDQDPSGLSLDRGETILIPACMEEVVVKPANAPAEFLTVRMGF